MEWQSVSLFAFEPSSLGNNTLIVSLPCTLAQGKGPARSFAGGRNYTTP